MSTLEVNYYLVQENTEFHRAITEYTRMCQDFCKEMETLVKKYNADSAVIQSTIFNREAYGLNFEYNKAPLKWEMNRRGSFYPPHSSDAEKDFKIEIPYFRDYYKKAPEGTRFGKLGSNIIISVTPNKDGSACMVKDTEILDSTKLDSLKSKASNKDLEHFKTLASSKWDPKPFLESPAFQQSEAVKRLNNEVWESRDSLRSALKHSKTGRIVNRILQPLHLQI